jgi:hypothetical protein
MTPGCPNSHCVFYHSWLYQAKDGRYYRRDDRHFIQRYKCRGCSVKYSASTHTLEYRQKKRTLNRIVQNELCSGVSQRRCARNLNLNRTTIARKLVYLALKARQSQAELLVKLSKSPVEKVQFDDLITSIHTRLKPAAISVVIESRTRLILGTRVSQLPAFGKIAHVSRKKYGKRADEHKENLEQLIKSLQGVIHPHAKFQTDEHKRYPLVLKKYFPLAEHEKYKSLRASVAGQGELKTRTFDPLFMINHTLAMFRANINRLFRKTWCTSKKEEALQRHVDIFVTYFNEMILEKMQPRLA